MQLSQIPFDLIENSVNAWSELEPAANSIYLEYSSNSDLTIDQIRAIPILTELSRHGIIAWADVVRHRNLRRSNRKPAIENPYSPCNCEFCAAERLDVKQTAEHLSSVAYYALKAAMNNYQSTLIRSANLLKAKLKSRGVKSKFPSQDVESKPVRRRKIKSRTRRPRVDCNLMNEAELDAHVANRKSRRHSRR